MDDYPLLDIFLTMIYLYFVVAWFWLLITLMADVFRSPDLSGGKKAAWTMGFVFFSFIAAIAYLVTRGGSMQERAARERAERMSAAGAASTADELAKLAALRDSGALTEEEFAAQKSRVLAS